MAWFLLWLCDSGVVSRLVELPGPFFGFQAASNFVFVYVMAVLVVCGFAGTLKYPSLKDRFDELISEQAVREGMD